MRSSLTSWICLAIIGISIYGLISPAIRSSHRVRTNDRPVVQGIANRIKSALGQYEVDSGSYPKSLQDLLVRPESNTNWHGPYMDKLPLDQWGKEYQYKYPGRHNTNAYDLFSAGPDGRIGTEDDIGNWTE